MAQSLFPCFFPSPLPSLPCLFTPAPLHEDPQQFDQEEQPPSPAPLAPPAPVVPSPAPPRCSPFKPHLPTLHRLIALHQRENRHLQFLLRVAHKQALRHKRRKLHPQPLFSKFCSFISRGRKHLSAFFIKFFSQAKAAVVAVHDALTSISFPPWHPPWPPDCCTSAKLHLEHCFPSLFPKHVLQCNATIFSFNNAEEEPGPARFDTDSIPVGADVCATATVSQHKHLFTNLQPVDGIFLKGVGGRIHVAAKGTLNLPLEDDEGEIHTFQIKDSFLVPDLPMTLLCPQQWAKQREEQFGLEDGAQFITKGNFSKFQWNNLNHTITVPMDLASNLPILNTAPSFQRAAHLIANPAALVSDDEDDGDDDEDTVVTTNQGSTAFPFKTKDRNPITVNDPVLPQDQADFLLLHEKLGHTPFPVLQKMSKCGLIPHKFQRCSIPVCASCQQGKQHKRPWRTRGSKPSPIGGKTIHAPGDCVSVDQLKSSTPGLIGQVKGWLTRERHHTATVFVDHHSDLTFVHVTPSDTSEETVEAKEAFERFAASFDVTIKHYHADNGRFADKLFREHVTEKGQTISFCGVGAHHQNGKVEKRIRDIVEQARTMLLHASHRWPKVVTANLWPFALHHAVKLRNSLAAEGATPISKFSKSSVKDNLFWRHQHTFGCPAFVLEAPLQGSMGGKRKWSDRSRVGVFLGHSSQHSQTVALVLNPKTGHVSPQFHVVFDDKFDTVKQGIDVESKWQEKADLADQVSDTFNVDIPHPKFTSPWITSKANPLASSPSPSTTQMAPPTPPSTSSPTPNIVEDVSAPPPAAPPQGSPGNPIPSPSPAPPTQQGTDHSKQQGNQEPRRSKRLQQPRRSPRFATTTAPHPLLLKAHFVRAGVITDFADGTINHIHPLIHAFAATKGDPDTMHLSEARRQPDWHKFKQGMNKEVNDFTERQHWELVPATVIDELKAKGIKFDIIQAVWSFKRKRTPSGELIKHKSRLCAHGGQQTSNTFWETFSPVVQWSTLRTILTLSIIQGWKARSIDFVLAYPQADLKANIFMRIPFGFKVDTPGKWLLKLTKNVYGLSDAGRTWALHLRQGLIDRGFKQSQVDPCVFFKGNLVLVIYVDDVIAFCPDDKPIDDFIQSMQEDKPRRFILEDQGPLKDYLGLEIVHKGDQVHITQAHLINKILNTANLSGDKVKTHATPAADILHKFPDSSEVPPDEAPFDYRSLIGQLNYLAATTRPDITFAVHQCAKFCSNPKLQHFAAAKRIARCLHGTRDKGLILNKTDTLIECFADADFAGAWDKDNPDDPTNCKSRTGFIIKFANCPIQWSSKQQELIALSTVEAEYIALSQATRQVLFILHLLEELKQHCIDFELPQTKIFAKCFEDNAGCVELAHTPKLRPRTKHIAVKFHHFLSYVKTRENPDGILHLQWIPTHQQQADIFTKPLAPQLFTDLRKLISGW